MYCPFYGLSEKPFAITPNPRFVYYSKTHREAFAHLLYGFDNHAGFIELTGEIGTGKTTVLRTLLSQLDEDKYRFALIFNPAVSAADLLALINREFGLPEDGSNSVLLGHLYQYLLQENAAGRTVILVVDEAQNLDPQVLEQIRLISNLETDNDKLIQIVLAGQPELADLLEKPELRQINQRVTVRYHLGPMDYEEMKGYIEHRLEVAGGRWLASFTQTALKRLFRETCGVPRLVNIICDRALVVGFAAGKREISGGMMGQAIAEVRGERKLSRTRMKRNVAAAAFVLLLVAGGIFFSLFQERLQSRASRPSLTRDQFYTQVQGEDPLGNLFHSLNPLLSIWKAPVMKETETTEPLDKIMSSRGLRLYRFTGSLGLLRRFDTPALLELVFPGKGTKRYVALVDARDENLYIMPRLGSHEYLSPSELEGVWSGRAFIPWRNSLDIPVPLVAGMQGEGVQRLQRLLKQAGLFSGEETGRYDRKTGDSIRSFQVGQGIAADGTVGEQTLFLLYQRAGKGTFPRFSGKEEMRRS